MNINPTDLLTQLAAANSSAARISEGLVPPSIANPPGAPAAPGSPGSAVGFEGLVKQFVGDVNQQQLNADQAVQALATGETDNVHDVVLTAVKANLSVRMLFEIRNQLVQAYQEVMRMQL